MYSFPCAIEAAIQRHQSSLEEGEQLLEYIESNYSAKVAEGGE